MGSAWSGGRGRRPVDDVITIRSTDELPSIEITQAFLERVEEASSSAPDTSLQAENQSAASMDEILQRKLERKQRQKRELEAKIQQRVQSELKRLKLSYYLAEGKDSHRLFHTAQDEMNSIKEAESKSELGSELNGPIVQKKKAQLLDCYRNNPSTTLNCWREVEEFKEIVRQHRLATL